MTKEKQRKREIQPIDQLWMFLTKVRLGLFERDLAHRFDVSVSTVSDVVVTWANYHYMLHITGVCLCGLQKKR